MTTGWVSAGRRANLAWMLVAGGAAIAIAAPRPAVAALIVVGALSLVLGYRAPIYGLAILLLTVPVQGVGAVQFGGLEWTWTKSALIGVIVGWLLASAARLPRQRLDAPALLLGGYLLALVLSVTNADSVGAWGEECYRWAVTLLVLILARDVVRSARDASVLIGAIGVGLAGSAAFAAYQFGTHAGPPSYQIGGITRVFGSFGAPNSFAIYLEMATLVVAAYLLERLARAAQWSRARIGRIELALGVSAIAGAATLALTQSRGGVLGFGAGALVLAMTARGWVRRWAGIAIGGALVVILATGGRTGISSRLDAIGAPGGQTQVTTANFAVQERIAHWRAAVAMWRAHPWLGIGAGNFDQRFREFTPTWRFRIGRGHAHNAYLQAAAQAGSIGLALYVLLMASMLGASGRAIRRRTPGPGRAAAVAACAMTVALAVHGLVEYTHVLSLGMVAAAVWAIGTGPGYPIEANA